jgi:heat shock protein HtpX
MATLYTQQESNIRRTWILFTSFLILVIGLGWIFSYVFQSRGILIFAVAFSIFSSFLSYWSSDKIALALARARQIEKKDNPYVWNMIENLTITAGLPMPRVYITPEKQINAFATGRDPTHAAIAVTQGAIDRLENEELEGVLAHELSHVGNRDILVMTVAVVLAGIISILSDFFLRAMWFGGRSREDNNRGGNILVLIGIAMAILAPLGAMLMQLAISRKREFLADASGALLTRYPEGLANALEKIKKDNLPMTAARDSTAHLWITNPFKGNKLSGLHKLFMTHPPIEERIAALRGMSL